MKSKKKKKPAKQKTILAAGGIVTRGQARPLFAVVRLRRQKSWVLPKGKLNRDETALAAARREAIEETGHDVAVREFLGSIAYQTAVRPKIVRFWRMEASGRPIAKLMKDVSAVRWMPLSRAIAKLTHEREKEFLARVGPQALSSLRQSRAPARPTSRAKQPPARAKRSVRPAPRKASKIDRPVRAGRRVVQFAPRKPGTAHKTGHRANHGANHGASRGASLGTSHVAPRQFMQALWRWLGR